MVWLPLGFFFHWFKSLVYVGSVIDRQAGGLGGSIGGRLVISVVDVVVGW